jgi:hypothetical protein
MSTAAMNAVEATKAGVASGILSMSRMVGGTFGIAAMGALISGLGRHRLDETLPQLPAGARERLVDGLGAGGAMSGDAGQAAAAAREAFVFALNSGLRLGAVVAAIGALVAWMLIGGRAERPAAAAVGEPALEPAG